MGIPEYPADAKSPLRRDFVPREDYVRDDLPKLETERLWPRVWQLACREEELGDVGSFVRYDIVNESFLIVRTAPDEIKAFYNVCPHRGRRLKTAESGNMAKGVMCPFHGWKFDMNGQVESITCIEDWADCSTFKEEDLSLIQPLVERWGGCVWINMDPDAPPLLEYMSPAAENLVNFDLEQLRMHWYKTLYVPVNWKIVQEAFMEGYHSIATHPQIMKFGEMRWPGPLDQEGLTTTHTTELHPHAGVDVRENTRGFILELADTVRASYLEPGQRAAERLLEEVPAGASLDEVGEEFFKFQREETIKLGAAWPESLRPEDLGNTVWHLFPNSSMIPTADGVLWYRIRPNPENYDHCIFDMWSLGRYAPGQEPNPPHEVFPTLESFKGQNPFLEQDFSNLLALQQGVQSRAWRGARLNPVQEVTLWAFHRNLRRYLGELAPVDGQG